MAPLVVAEKRSASKLNESSSTFQELNGRVDAWPFPQRLHSASTVQKTTKYRTSSQKTRM